jgi:hypothetical protein
VVVIDLSNYVGRKQVSFVDSSLKLFLDTLLKSQKMIREKSERAIADLQREIDVIQRECSHINRKIVYEEDNGYGDTYYECTECHYVWREEKK